MRTRNKTTVATRRRNAALVCVIVAIAAVTVIVRLVADGQAPAEAPETPAATQATAATPEPATTAVSTPATAAETPIPTGQGTFDESSLVPAAVQPAPVGTEVASEGVTWRFDVAASYDPTQLATASRRVAEQVAQLPEGERTLHVRGFVDQGEARTYAALSGSSGQLRVIVTASGLNQPDVSVRTSPTAQQWQAIVDAGTRAQTPSAGA